MGGGQRLLLRLDRRVRRDPVLSRCLHDQSMPEPEPVTTRPVPPAENPLKRERRGVAMAGARRAGGDLPRRAPWRGDDGNRTRVHGFAGRCLTTRPRRQRPKTSGPPTRPHHERDAKRPLTTCARDRCTKSGADDEIRTRDLNLGKVALYQLSYVRKVTDCTSRLERCGNSGDSAQPRPARAAAARMRSTRSTAAVTSVMSSTPVSR